MADWSIDNVNFVVAWARYGGLRRLEADIRSFRNRGGTLRIILGIDEGVATKAGLMMAIELADEAFVFHDPGVRTFHPKVYLGTGADRARLLVGSSNVTAGGLFSNYEASLEASFDLPQEAAADALVDVTTYIDKLLGDGGLCRPLDVVLLNRMISDPRYSIAEFERRASGGGRGGDAETDQFGETDQQG